MIDRRPTAPMSGEEMAACRKEIGWTRVDLAKRIGCVEGTVRAMEAGTRAIPPPIAGWLRMLVEVHSRPAPAFHDEGGSGGA